MAAKRNTIKWVKNAAGGGAVYMDFPEGDSQTYLKGTPSSLTSVRLVLLKWERLLVQCLLLLF